MNAVVDYREQPSGIVELMTAAHIDVRLGKVACGDFILDGILTVERKTARDLIVSIIDGRLFRQMANLKKNCDHPVVLIEGNPFQTGLDMNRSAIKGALVNVQTVWNIPVVYSRSMEDSIELMQIMAHQFEKLSTLMPVRAGISSPPHEFQATLCAARFSGSRTAYGQAAVDSLWIGGRRSGRFRGGAAGRKGNRTGDG